MLDPNIHFRAVTPFQLQSGINQINAQDAALQKAQGDEERRGQLRDFFAQNGAGVFKADPQALAALAALDPGLAQKAQAQAAELQMANANLGLAEGRLDLARQGQQFNQGVVRRREERADQQIALATRAQQIQEATLQIDRALAQLATAETPEQWDAISQRVAPDFVGQFGNRDALIAEQQGLKETLNRLDKNGKDIDLSSEAGLRKEWTALTKGFRAQKDAFGKIVASAKTASAEGDIALITAYMKVLDPSSVVRETEFATAQYAASVPEQLQSVYQQLLTGERLLDERRGEFVRAARNLIESSAQDYRQSFEVFREIALDSGLDPERVIPDFMADPLPVYEPADQVQEKTTQKQKPEAKTLGQQALAAAKAENANWASMTRDQKLAAIRRKAEEMSANE
mgnify:CR=1 FL=1